MVTTRGRRTGWLPGAGRRPAGWMLAALAGALLLMTPAGAAVTPPPLTYTLTTLPNGLRIVVHEDRSTPLVNVQVWYHVGSKDEREGRTGFAHFFEHMMFKGSKNVDLEQHTALISAVGGQSNAYTTEDVTVFWNTVPSSHLPLALWLEADRMATLRFDRQVFEYERQVVKEERRLRVENQPYGRLPEIIYDFAFTVHPYKYQTIGSMADLEAASLGDVRDFYRAYYVPNNATIAIAGDVDAAAAVGLATKYFGRIPRKVPAVPRNIPKEPPITRPRRATVVENWPLPVVVVGHHVTYDGHPDSYPLHMATKILSDGQSSRIYRRLVYEQGLALAAFGGGNIVEHPNLFFAVAVVQPGHTVAAAESALSAELDRLRDEPVTEDELRRAKNQFARDYIVGRTTVRQKAAALAHAVVIHNDAASADGEFAIFQTLTAADVQRVARTYFKPESRFVVTILPKALKGEAK